MNKFKTPVLVMSVLLLAFAAIFPALAKAGFVSGPHASDVHVALEWAAFTEDHASVNYVVAGHFEVPDGYLPITCPVSEARLFDAAGNDLTGAVVTSCRPDGDNKYTVTQFFYSDFQNRAPEKLEVAVGDIVVMPAGNGKVSHLPLVGSYSFVGQFKPISESTAYPARGIEQGRIAIVVNRVDFTPSTIKVDACIDLPDNRDWVPNAYLSIDGKRIPADEWFIPNFREDPSVFERRERCYTFFFYTGVPDFRHVDRGSIAFGVAELHTNIPECVDASGIVKIKDEMERHGFRPEIDPSGYYCFMREIVTSSLAEGEKATLFEYIEKNLPEHVQGPFEVEIY